MSLTPNSIYVARYNNNPVMILTLNGLGKIVYDASGNVVSGCPTDQLSDLQILGKNKPLVRSFLEGTGYLPVSKKKKVKPKRETLPAPVSGAGGYMIRCTSGSKAGQYARAGMYWTPHKWCANLYEDLEAAERHMFTSKSKFDLEIIAV
jgi:hypothetical protein